MSFLRFAEVVFYDKWKIATVVFIFHNANQLRQFLHNLRSQYVRDRENCYGSLQVEIPADREGRPGKTTGPVPVKGRRVFRILRKGALQILQNHLFHDH